MNAIDAPPILAYDRALLRMLNHGDHSAAHHKRTGTMRLICGRTSIGTIPDGKVGKLYDLGLVSRDIYHESGRMPYVITRDGIAAVEDPLSDTVCQVCGS